MNYKYIIAFDPSTQNIGVSWKDFRCKNSFSIYPRTHEISEKSGKELKKSYYNKNIVVNRLTKWINVNGMDFDNPNEVLIVLPDNGGNLNVTTIKKLERLNGLVEGIFACNVGRSLINKDDKECIHVVYINEMKARSKILSGIPGGTWKEKAMNYSGLDNHDEADARVLLDYVIDELRKEK